MTQPSLKKSNEAADLIRGLVESLMVIDKENPLIPRAIEWLTYYRNLQQVAQIAELPRWVKTKGCYNCGEDIFFAQRGIRDDGSIIWVPICPYPIESEFVVLDALTVGFIQFHKHSPLISDETLPGVQWLPHQILCGLRERPIDPDVAEIWEKTAQSNLGRKEKALEGLLTILDDTE